MPYLALEGRSIFYERNGVPGAPVLLFSNSLGTTLEMWEPQVKSLQANYDLVRYDMRGHGKSSTPAGPYSLDQLGGDVVALVKSLGLTRVAFCGLSIGGVIGQWLAVHAAQYFRVFILANTAMKIGTVESWKARIAVVEQGGMASIAFGVMKRWFTPSFYAAAPHVVDNMRLMLVGSDPVGYVWACGALRDMPLPDSFAAIRTPTCILAGEHDRVTTVADAQSLQLHIVGSRLVQLSAAHISNVEAAAEFNAAIFRFLKEQDLHG